MSKLGFKHKDETTIFPKKSLEIENRYGNNTVWGLKFEYQSDKKDWCASYNFPKDGKSPFASVKNSSELLYFQDYNYYDVIGTFTGYIYYKDTKIEMMLVFDKEMQTIEYGTYEAKNV